MSGVCLDMTTAFPIGSVSGVGSYRASSSALTTPSVTDPDADLMLRLREGDLNCFGRLLERHRSAVIHHLFRLVQNISVAEELAQEVFLRVYRSRSNYQPTAKFTTWLYRIATHLGLNWIRDGRHEKSHASLDEALEEGTALQITDARPNVEYRLLHEVKLKEVRRAILLLPEKQRSAVMMHKYSEMEYSQIAVVLGCSESAVKSLLFRAYENLRARLAQYAPVPEVQ
jgi:RNA polymerase sigma-70 factor (ECF subfamily)